MHCFLATTVLRRLVAPTILVSWALAPTATAQVVLTEIDLYPLGANPTGTAIVGYPQRDLNTQGRRWTTQGGASTLAVPSGFSDAWPGNDYPEDVRLVSDNGTFVAGTAWRAIGEQAVRWNGSVPTPLGALAGYSDSTAIGISAAGDAVYGSCFGSASGNYAGFRWMASGPLAGMRSLGVVSTDYSHIRPWSASADCSVIVGAAERLGGGEELSSDWAVAFRWSDNAIASLGVPQGYQRSSAHAVSDDGDVVVVNAEREDELFMTTSRLHRWCAGRYARLPVPGGYTDSGAGLVSGDGSTIVGWAGGLDGYHAAAWTVDGGMRSLAPMERVSKVSANGRVIVGSAWSDDVFDFIPYIWTEALGVRRLDVVLASQGVNLAGRTLLTAGCSADGKVIGGSLVRDDGSETGFRVTGLTLAGTGTPPAPGRVRASDGTSNAAVTVTWQASPGATGYKVFRGVHPTTPTLVATLGNVVTYTDSTAEPGAIYEYWVRATNAAGQSGVGSVDEGWRGIAGASTPSFVHGLGFSPHGSNPDGSVLVGYVERREGYGYFRWTSGPTAQGTLVELKPPPGYEWASASREDEDYAATVSANGSFLSGSAYNWSEGGSAAVRWLASSPTNPTVIPALPGWQGSMFAQGISSDGSKVFGNAGTPAGSSGVLGEAYVWTAGASQATNLGVVSGFEDTSAWGGSGDLSVIVGQCARPVGEAIESVAFRWSNGTMSRIDPPAGFDNCGATAVSGDGSVVWGLAWGDSVLTNAFRWSNGRMRLVSTPTDAEQSFIACKSRDGSAVVVASNGGTPGFPNDELFRWSLADGAMSLAPMNVWESSISDNGMLVIGHSYDENIGLIEPYLWTPAIGVRRLQDYLVSRGVNLQGKRLGYSNCSPDGKVLFGEVINPDGTLQSGYRLTGLAIPGASAPAAPADVRATDGLAGGAVTVTWTSSPGATGYKVFRSTGSAPPTEVASLGSVSSHADSTAAPGTVYEYTVRAFGPGGTSGIGGADSGWLGGAGPSGVQASDGTSTSGVVVTWSALGGATGYKVLRAQGSAAAEQVSETLSAGATTFTDTTAVAGTIYAYSVRAVTSAGDTAASASNTGWRNVAAPSGVSATDGTSTANVTVTWTAVPGATGHKVFRAVGTAAATQVASLGATAATYADTTAAAGTVCTYTVKATTAAGDSAASAADTGWRNVAAPTGLAATDGTFPDKVRLTWTVHASTAVTGYRVLRRLPSETEFALITTISSRTTVTHDDFDIPATVVGTYVVQGVTAAGATDSSTSNTGFRQGAPPAGAPPADEVPPPEGGTAGSDPPPGMAPPAAATGPGPSAGHGTSGAGQGGEGPSTDNGDEDDGNEPDDGQSGDRCFDLAGRIVLLLIRPTPPEAYGRADELDDLLTRVPGTDATSSPVASDSVACLMLRGDLTLDGRVDSLDALCFTAAWCSQDAYLADLDRDGCITELDLDAMIDALEGSSGDIGDLEPLRP